MNKTTSYTNYDTKSEDMRLNRSALVRGSKAKCQSQLVLETEHKGQALERCTSQRFLFSLACRSKLLWDT